MAIHLITGTPGAGKSLRAVWECVRRISTEDEQDRPVFGNVRAFRRQAPLPGSRFQHPDGRFEDIPGTWMDCPDGSIILIDEVQERWRRYRATGEPPPEIAALERHRHRNIDFILTCQNPKQLSDDVRSLVDIHEHLTKKTKNSAGVYRWRGRCSTTPYTSRREADCEVSIWRFPKSVFKEYLSAEVHTVRTKVPRLYVYAALALVALPLSFWYAINNVSAMRNSSSTPVEAVVTSPDPVPVSLPSTLDQGQPTPTPTAVAYGGAVMGDRCQLIDDQGRPLLTSRPQCFHALEGLLPIEVEILQF